MQNHFRFDRFEVRPAERLLLIDGEPAVLGARSFDLLLCLLERRDRVVTKNEVLDLVWSGLVVEENNLSVQVSALRKVLGPQAITTIPGRGYRFSLEVSQEDRSAPDEAHKPPALHEKSEIGRSSTPVELPVAFMDRPTIAVLPFNVLSDDSSVNFLAEGLAEDVIALLARVPGFLLISYASSFVFRGRKASLTEVAHQLGVRYVVEGSVRPMGEVLRVSTQLTDAASGRVLWSSRFDSSNPGETVDFQDGIVRGIISELEPELTRAEIAHIHRQRPENQDAWAHYHQAVGALALKGWGEDAMAEARAQLQKSVTIDPAFGLGHAYYAVLTILARNTGLLPASPDLENEVFEVANRAIELDEGSSKVLGYAGCALSDLGHHDRGVEILHQALEIDPSNAQAHVALGASLALMGQFEAGIDKMRFGMKISPRDRGLGFWGWALGVFLLNIDKLDEALVEARTSSRRDSKFYLSHVLEAAVLDRLGLSAESGAALAVARHLRKRLTLNEVALTHGRRVGERMALLWRPVR